MAVAGIRLRHQECRMKYKAKSGICVTTGHSKKARWMSWRTTMEGYNGNTLAWVWGASSHRLHTGLGLLPRLRGCHPVLPPRYDLGTTRARRHRARRRSAEEVGQTTNKLVHVGWPRTSFFHPTMFSPSPKDFVPAFLFGIVGLLRVPSVACNYARRTTVCT